MGQDKKFRKNDMLVWWVREVHFPYFSASVSFMDCFFVVVVVVVVVFFLLCLMGQLLKNI